MVWDIDMPTSSLKQSQDPMPESQLDGAENGTTPNLLKNDKRNVISDIIVFVLFIAIYVPVFIDISPLWESDRGGHCPLIIPLCLALVWLRRSDLAKANLNPKSWGGAILAGGLLLEIVSYLLRIRYFEGYSLVPVIAGYVLLRYGVNTWRYVLFPIILLLFIVPPPPPIYFPLITWISRASATGAVYVISILGYPVFQSGNIIDIVGVKVEVADICSGFNKLTILILFGSLYAYLFPISNIKRAVLVVSALPIALIANVLRVSIILLVSIYFGEHGLHIIHDWAELIVVAIAFVLYIVLGSNLGCRRPRFTI